LNKELIKSSCLFIFLFFLSLQGTRALAINFWSILKDSYHLYSLAVSEKRFRKENLVLKNKIKEIQSINKNNLKIKSQ